MIFARRALQRRLDELRRVLPEETVAAWAARLNTPGRDRLAAMWEVAVIHALTNLGPVEVETSLASGRRPDVVFRGSTPFVADITTVSDEGLHDANPFSELLDEIERAKSKLGLAIGGVKLTVASTEIVTGRGRRRVLRLPPRKRIRELVHQHVVPALKAQIAAGETVLSFSLDNETAGFSLTIDPASSPYNSGSYAGYAVPTIKDDNPLYRALKAKAKQLRSGHRRAGVIVGDGATSALRSGNLGPSTVPPDAIAQEFLRQHRSIDFVLLLTVHEAPRAGWTAAPPDRRLEANLVTRRGHSEAAALDTLFKDTLPYMPRPTMSAVNGALRAREAGYDLGHHGGYSMGGSKITMSSRELLEVLAGRRTLADEGARNVEAARALRRGHTGALEQAFRRMLQQGRLPSEIRVLKGDEDGNDDWIEFDFGPPDPAISRLR